MLTNGGDVNAWLSETEKSLRYAFALKGQNMKAQGNALGKWPNKTPSPERATYTNLGTQSIALASLNSPFQGYFDGDLLPGVALRFHPGLSHFTPSGLRNQRPSFFVKARKPRILKERMDSRIRWGDESAGPLRQAQGPGFLCYGQ